MEKLEEAIKQQLKIYQIKQEYTREILAWCISTICKSRWQSLRGIY